MEDNGNGISSEDFEEYVTTAYHIIMAETQAELYEGPDYTIPEFQYQLSFVANCYSLLSL